MSLPTLKIRRRYAVVVTYPDGGESIINTLNTFKEAEQRIEEIECTGVAVRESCGLLEKEQIKNEETV